MKLFGRAYARGSVFGFDDAQPPPLQEDAEQKPRVLVVFHDEDERPDYEGRARERRTGCVPGMSVRVVRHFGRVCGINCHGRAPAGGRARRWA